MSEQQIANAIRHKLVLSIRYKEEVRVIEPHLLGYDRDGHLTLSAWQISGIRPGWRDFHVEKLRAMSTTGQTFAMPRKGYNPMDTTMTRVVCRL
ncbi:WYL domain-containing protein [Sphingobium sp. PNB]|uniref:WYL domain-containing protein n=1 Tax=Sphingobium sp. PNB TaxID=863934 RepID=UPI001CA3D837|nr:WYL domain-containing protein [Sphingobium sp. PNB]MCB4862357.1 WYL domain-containing protein [Sphingobium sp. PNB]